MKVTSSGYLSQENERHLFVWENVNRHNNWDACSIEISLACGFC